MMTVTVTVTRTEEPGPRRDRVTVRRSRPATGSGRFPAEPGETGPAHLHAPCPAGAGRGPGSHGIRVVRCQGLPAWAGPGRAALRLAAAAVQET